MKRQIIIVYYVRLHRETASFGSVALPIITRNVVPEYHFSLKRLKSYLNNFEEC